MSSGSSIPRAASTAKAKDAGRASLQPRTRVRLSETQPVYRTRRWLWSLLAVGWIFTLTASVLRGEMPELFAAVLLSGIMIVGALPVIAVRAAGIEAIRTLSAPEAEAGGELHVTLTLRMRMPLPLLWVFVREECMNESGGQPRLVHYGHVGLPWQRREWQVAYTVRELARGAYRFRAMEVTIGDAFGLTAMKHVVPVRMAGDERKENRGGKESLASRDKADRPSFLVLPDWTGSLELPSGSGKSRTLMESRPADAPAGGYLHSAERARSKSMPRQRTTVADGAGVQRQPYRPGDDARHIDWRAASRGGGWVTKREPASQPPALLMLLDPAAETYEGNDYWFDAAAGYAAAQIRYAVNKGITFRLLGGTDSAGMQQASRLSTQREAMERLARMKPVPPAAAGERDKGVGGIDAMLNHEGMNRGATFLLITAEWRSGDLGERLAAYAVANGCRIEVHVLTAKRLPSAAMRARQRDWENAGIRVVWIPMPDSSDIAQQTAIVEGGEANERASH